MTSFLDEDKIEKLIGKNLLVGITYLDHTEKLIEQKQYFGTIIRINEKEGVIIHLTKTDKEFALPPDLRPIKKAPPGKYTLKATKEVIVNPDYLATWTSTAPPPKK